MSSVQDFVASSGKVAGYTQLISLRSQFSSKCVGLIKNIKDPLNPSTWNELIKIFKLDGFITNSFSLLTRHIQQFSLNTPWSQFSKQVCQRFNGLKGQVCGIQWHLVMELQTAHIFFSLTEYLLPKPVFRSMQENLQLQIAKVFFRASVCFVHSGLQQKHGGAM